MRWARQQGIVTATRGSVAGSLVAYALGITTTNPLSFELPFERFLTLERPVPPDIDMDFADDRRGEVLRYVTEKYGSDKVAQIITFGTMMARAAIRDIGRALGVAYSKCDRLAKMIPLGRFGFHTTINDALRISKEFHQAYEQDGESKRIIDLAKKLEGVVRHASVHAAGVVIAPTPLVDYVPLQLDTESKNVITQYDMHAVEEAGLVKMDFLGIRYLAILGNAVEIIKHTRGTTVDLAQIPLDDEKTYALLTEGRTMGVFQLGGAGMTRYLVLLKPSNIFDIMAMVALFRPGPMEFIPEYIRRKHDSSLIEYLDPRLEELLTRSYGVITYQDDVLLIAVKIAGYTWEEADKLRKAMGKKIPSEMREQKEKFIAGCMQNGIMETRAHELWRRIEPFAAYGFNKAHAASYAMVAYQTAYLKANFPVEFMAALMTAEAGDLETVALAVEECKELGIQVLPPDVNESLDSFTVIDNMTIRFGLAAIKHLSSEVTKAVIEEREAHGVFRDLADLASRMPIRTFNKKSWEALVKCGALDRFGERNSLLANTEEILGYIRLQQKARTSGQEALFGIEGAPLRLREVPPAPQNEKLAWEKEYLGLYVSAHPLDQHAETLKQYAKPIRDLTELNDGAPCIVGGLFSRTQRILTKNGEQMAFCTLEDTTGSVEVLVFPKIYQQIKDRLLPERITLVRGRITTRDNELKIIADEVKGLPAKNNRPS
jgi:DNA polymerase-3 subunit alpha